jgi:hypothetical protein
MAAKAIFRGKFIALRCSNILRLYFKKLNKEEIQPQVNGNEVMIKARAKINDRIGEINDI